MAKLTKRKRLAKLFWGACLAPISNLFECVYGLGCGIYLASKKQPYLFEKSSYQSLDIQARVLPFTFHLGRAVGLIFTTLCILGFIGALAIPIPSIAPLYTLTAASIAKAYGMTLAVTMLGRATGALLGTLIDCFYRKGYVKNRFEFIFKTTLSFGLFGKELNALPIRLLRVQLWCSKPRASCASNDEPQLASPAKYSPVHKSSMSTSSNNNIANFLRGNPLPPSDKNKTTEKK